MSKNKIKIQKAPPSNIIAVLQLQGKREKYMYIMHENVSYYFQWSLHVELSSTYLQTWCIYKAYFWPKLVTEITGK